MKYRHRQSDIFQKGKFGRICLRNDPMLSRDVKQIKFVLVNTIVWTTDDPIFLNLVIRFGCSWLVSFSAADARVTALSIRAVTSLQSRSVSGYYLRHPTRQHFPMPNALPYIFVMILTILGKNSHQIRPDIRPTLADICNDAKKGHIRHVASDVTCCL